MRPEPRPRSRAFALSILSPLLLSLAMTGCGKQPAPSGDGAGATPTAPGAGGGDATAPAPGAGGAAPSPAPAPAPASPIVAVIPKGTTHVFWTTVEAGARDGAAATGLEIAWKGPLQENDRAQQIDLVSQFVAQKVRGIVLAPLDHRALVRPVAAAREAGIPVVIFDSALDGAAGADFACFVGTNNLEAGRMAGAHLAGLVHERGEVVLLRYLVGSASTEARESGFLDAIGAHDEIEVTVQDRHAGATAGEAQTAALNIVDRLRTASGIFCSNESATMGMLLALRQAGLAGTKRFVGFDASPPLVEALRKGEIDALVVQNPRGMGRAAVEAMATLLDGGSVPPEIDTGVVVVTRENIDTPDVAALLK